jgi:cobalt-zinc-cadmium efflux system protein
MNDPHHHCIKANRLLWATLLNFSIAIVEVIGGIVSNSLALLSDALHNVGDGLAVLLAYIANLIGRRPSNERKTFGYKRIEILAAFLNALFLIVISLFLFYEAILRLLHPQEVQGRVMLIVAVIGLFANLVAALILHRDSRKNINVRAAYLHLVADTLSSVAVIIGAILIYRFKIYWIDPVITILIGIYIIKETWTIFRQTVDILMQSTPANIHLKEIVTEIEKIPGIANVHHVHAWNLDDQSVNFECHVELDDDYRAAESEVVHKQIEILLEQKYHISHITIQFEYKWCHDREVNHS